MEKEIETPDPSAGAEAFSLDSVDDDKLSARLAKLPALSKLFEAPAEPAPKAKLEGGGQKVRPNESGDVMTELVTTLVKGLKAQAREEVRTEPKSSAPAAPERQTSWFGF